MARDFPGTAGNYLSVGDVAAIDITGTQLTLSCWIRPDVVNAVGAIIAKWDLSNRQYMLYLQSDAKLQFRTGSGGSENLRAGGVLTAGVWQHVAGVHRGTGASDHIAFLNGSAVATGSGSVSMTVTSLSLLLGAYGAGSDPFDGR